MSSSASSNSSSPSSSSTKKLLHLFHLRDPAVHAQKKQFAWGTHLGSGTYGEVSRCVWKTHKPKLEVAIKIVPKSKIPNQAQQERILRHASKLRHPHIISLHHWFHSRHHYYMVFELAEGGELFDHIIVHGRFNDSHARKMVTDITSALAYIHSQGIVHRDLKPENLFVRGHAPFEPPFDLILADFGVSVPLSSESDQITGVCGSPGYTAPEVYRKEPYGTKVDIWSLGTIAFILLCGRFPFAHLQGQAFLDEVDNKRKPARFPKSFGLTQLAEDFIMACLKVDPNERLTAEEALNHPWLTGLSEVSSVNETGTKCERVEEAKKVNRADDESVEVIEFPQSDSSTTTSQPPALAEVQFCRTRTISEGPRSAM